MANLLSNTTVGGSAVITTANIGSYALTSITSANVITALGYTPVTSARTITINGTALDLSANRTFTISTITGNAGTATTFSTGRTNYKGTTDNAVAGQLMWKNYGNQHTIFDASAGTSPDGGSVNNTNSQVAWTGTYPTLMGWNGSQTYGVRVDSARVADNTTGNAATATTLQTARTISLGTSVTSTATSFNGSANITIPITGVSEAYLTWGGRNLAGNYGPIDAALMPDLGANRLAFTAVSAVTIEYSRDGGATWIDYGASDAVKTNLLNGNYSGIQVGGGGYPAGTDYTSYRVRVTINTSGQIYTVLNKFIILVSTNGSTGTYCTIDARTQTNFLNAVDTWTVFSDQTPVTGWSGYNVINLSGLVTFGNTPASQYGQVRLTFGQTGYNTTYTGLTIQKILGFGGVGWQTPSTLAATGQIYTYDHLKNVGFPATVTATTFSGALSGNSTTATTLQTARTINGTSFNGSASIDTSYWGTSRTLTIGNTGKSVNGSANVSWTLAEIGAADVSHNHTYNVNDAWLRENGDNAHVKLYGNSRQMVFRTDGTSEYASGVGGYPFAWMYNGDAASNRRMLLNDSGQLWLSNYGWLHEAFAPLSHTHTIANVTGLQSALDGKQVAGSYLTTTGGTLTGQLNLHAGSYEGSIVFGSESGWRTGIRQHDDADAELRIWAKNANGMIFIATGYDGEPASISRPTDGLAIQGNKLGIGNFSAEDPLYKLHVKGDIYANGGLIRVSGSDGFYFESYGGGWRMTDSTWIRAYNDKNIYTAGSIEAGGSVRADSGIYDANRRFIIPGGASTVNHPSGTGGAIRIDLPTAAYGINTMMSMTVQVYEYTTGQSFTLKIGGYNYFSHDWYNVFAYLLNDSGKISDIPVYFGNNGTRDVIWIGNPDWSWSYPNVFVTDFQAGHSQSESWKTGWSISFDTAARTNVSASRTAHRQIDTGNIGSQSVSYASTAGSLSSMNISQFTNNSGYLTGITSGQVTGALGYTPYNSSNPSGYITSSGSISGNAGTVTNGVYTNSSAAISGDNHITFGPNSTWGCYLRVGGNGRTVSGDTYASMVTTNGNLHLDGGNARGIYLNYYAGTSGVAFGNGASGVVAWMGSDGDLWKGSSDNSGTQYVYNSGTWSISINGNAATATTAGALSSMNISQFTNNSGYITGISFANVSSKPTTISGYGITDAITTSNIGSQSVSNASTAGGLAVHSSRNNEANKIVRTDANGYIQAGWINTPSGVFSSAITKIYCSDDDYVRFQTPATFISNLGLITTSNIGSQSVSSATTATSATYLNSSNYISQRGSNGSWNADFTSTPAGTMSYAGDLGANTTNGPGGTWWIQQNFRHTNSSNYWGTQVAWGWEDNANRLATRNITGGNYGAWVYYLNSSNFTTYAPSLTGTGASGTWGISVTGSAGSVAWTNVSSRPTALSQFTNDLGNYGGFLTSITAHSHAISDVTGLQTALDGKQAAGSYSLTSHTHADATTSVAGFMSAADKTKLNGIASGATANAGTVTSVSGTGTVSGLTLSGTVTSSGSLTLGGTLSLTSANVTTALGFTPYNATNPSGYITSSGSISGSAGSVTGLTLNSSANGINPDSVTQNQIGYNTSVSLFGQSDGGLYSSAYSSSWIHQIYGDFRTGQIAIRGKNNGTWQAWRTVLDSSNFSTWAAAASHTHTIANITGLQTALDGKQVAGSYAAASHTHTIANVTGLQTALDGKAASSHTHAISDVTGLQTALDGKALSSHTHTIANVTGLQTALDGKQASGSYLTTSGKAADSELIDGIDSSRIVYGDGSRGKSISRAGASANASDSTNASGFYFGNNVTGLPTTDYWNWVTVAANSWSGSDGYQFQLAGSFWSDDYRIRRMTSGTNHGWVSLIHSGNIGSQSVSYASTAGSATSATTAESATIATQLNKFGDIYGQDWNTYYVNGKMIVSSVYGGSGPNFPTGAYNYGAMLSYGVTGSDFFQVYFPENGALQGGAFRKLHYRTGWNGSWSAWKSVVDQEGQVCTIAGSNQTGIEIHSNVGYNQDPLTYFLIRGQADTSWKALKVRLTGDAGGQDIEFRRIAENGTDARMWYIPRGANTVNFDYPIVQPSDSRLKDNITPISTPVDKIKSLRGVEFDWNSGEQVGTHDVGLIAQEVEAVLPEAVTTQEDGYKNLAYVKVIPLLVEAMKEQQAMIEVLKAEIELLKNK